MPDQGASKSDVDSFRRAITSLETSEMGSMLVPQTSNPEGTPKSALNAFDDALNGEDAALVKSLTSALNADDSSDVRPSEKLAEIMQLQRRNLNVSLAERAIGKSVSAIDQLVKMN
ncbi:hypothetical protein [Burkholderia cepacia]|uniref:hypothetical protein n=1 Tax=Burkholderia cepacia TaxID=292 RepID=UPI0012D8C71D|nr:hypothetical protein [Burkholderia cepacia]